VANDPLVSNDEPLRAMIQDWKDYLVTNEDATALTTIRRDTPVSRPLGAECLVQALERRLRRPLLRRKPGPEPRE
jgi:hypothetical protein